MTASAAPPATRWFFRRLPARMLLALPGISPDVSPNAAAIAAASCQRADGSLASARSIASSSAAGSSCTCSPSGGGTLVICCAMMATARSPENAGAPATIS